MKREIQKAFDALLSACKNPISELDKALLQRAVETIYNNQILPQNGETLGWGTRRSFAPSLPRYVGHWNWDSAFYAMALLKWDPALAREQADILFSAQHENGCLPNLVLTNGVAITNRSQPPVWFWAYREIDEAAPDNDALCNAYAVLTKYERFWTTRRCVNGLFRYDTDEDKNPYFVKFESGWDTSPRWDTYTPDALWPIDLNCYMVLAYQSLSYMAQRLGKQDDYAHWSALENDLVQRINSKLWHEELLLYSDTIIETGLPTCILTPASFLPLFVGIADERQAECMARIAGDPQKFYPLMPSVAYDAPQYASADYFRGPTWLNISYMALIGLERYGYTRLADAFRNRLLTMCAEEKRGLFEYYDSRSGEGRGACGYGWTAAFLIKLIL